jgi:hypothetical protein
MGNMEAEVRLTMKERQSVIAVVAGRYRKAGKKDKGRILDEFTQLTRYNRSYASWVLRMWGKRIRINNKLVIVGDWRKRIRRNKPRSYDEKVLSGLRKIWVIMDCMCGKRLVGVIGELIPVLEEHGEIELDTRTKQKLLKISASTIDRALAPERKRLLIRTRSRTKPGTLLKHKIPIKTFSQWDEQRPGFVEIDLVGHDGGNIGGDYIQTLDVTDVCTGWTETQAVRNKAQVWVFEALKRIRECLPFKLLGIDSDNGSEFINGELYRYCLKEEITFTRARAYRKNDNCYVEQKNWSVVRRALGYLRYDTQGELEIINRLHGYLRLYTNHFQPVMKMIEKTREGSRVKKKYDKPRTPYQRVLDTCDVEKGKKEALKREHVKLNPAELKRQITRLQDKLRRIGVLKRKKQNYNENNDKNHKDFEYIFREATN